MDEKPNINLISAKKEDNEWIQDSKGYFLIEPRANEKLIYVHYYDNENNYKQSISGKTTEEIYYTILRLGLIGSLHHAAYLGAELQKAELSMKTNKPYIQDKELL